MALIVPPLQSASILLPILIAMDWVGVWAYRKSWDKALLILMLPAAICGIAAGGLLARYMSEHIILICVGLIAVLFPIYAGLKPNKMDAISLYKNR